MGLGAKTDNSASKALKAEQEREAQLKKENEERDREDKLAFSKGLRGSRSLLSSLPTGYPAG